jgi:para-nitrobenzyl esterase
VTIFGESAGGTGVFSLLVSPRASGLFHRAIAQSGSTDFHGVEAAENLREEGGVAGSSNEVLLSLLQADGKADDRDAARARLAEMASADIAEYLRNKPAEALLETYLNDEAEGLIEMPLTFREGSVIPLEDARERFSDPETWNVVPVIAGTNRDENKLFMYANPTYVKQRFGFLPRLVDEERFNLEARYRSLMWRASGADEPVAAMRSGNDAVWSYRFDWDEEPSVLGANLAVMLGAAHGFEIPFVFGHFNLGEAGNIIFTDDNLAGRQELSNAMMSYWARFAATGDPGRGRDGSLPQWSAWNPADDAGKFMILDTTGGGGLRMAPGSVTQSSVLATAEADPSLAMRKDRCVIMSQIVAWSDVALPTECEGIDPAIEASEVAASVD